MILLLKYESLLGLNQRPINDESFCDRLNCHHSYHGEMLNMAGQLDEAEKQVLATLLVDFVDQGLSLEDLNSGYKGPPLGWLERTICNTRNITKVDFDIAFSELEKNKLVRTGPIVPYERRPDDRAILINFHYSKREYAYLSADGYKAARNPPNQPLQSVQRVVNNNNVHISGGEFGNLQLATGDRVQQSMTVTNGADSEVISQLVAILEAQGKPVNGEQRAGIEDAVSEAGQGNAGTAKSLLAKVCGPMWESLQPVMWPILGEVVKKSIGL